MKRFISLLLSLLLLLPLCSCEYVYELELQRKEQQEKEVKTATVATEVEKRPQLQTPAKDPSDLENYTALYKAAAALVKEGTLSLRHYLISENVGNDHIEGVVKKGYALTAKDFKNTDAFLDTCLFYLILTDSFFDDSSSFVQKTSDLSENEKELFVETRLQMLKFLAEKSQNADPDAVYAACALYTIEDVLLKNREVFHCYDLLCRKAINAAYPTSFVSTATDELEGKRWEITKRCYDGYTNGDLTAKETLDTMEAERQTIGDHVGIYDFLKY